MQIPTVERCCGANLRTGGLVISTVALIASIFALILTLKWMELVGVAVANAMFVYGIAKDKPFLMEPLLWCWGIGHMIFYVVPIMNFYRDMQELRSIPSILVAWLVVYLIAACGTYLFIVQYSLYKQIVESSSDQHSSESNSVVQSTPEVENQHNANKKDN